MNKKTVKLGIFGLRRGADFYNAILENGGEVVAVLEENEERVEFARKKFGKNLAVYHSFEEFIQHPMDAVFLCNYFNEHTKYAIACLEKNIHVLSETTSNATMSEGVALVRAAEKSKAIYMLAENYPFMTFNLEMNNIVKNGSLGKIMFAEGEYNHPVSPNDVDFYKLYHPHAKHWRNYLPITYYITHSLAPLMYIADTRPVRVSAFPISMPAQENSTPMSRMGYNPDRTAIISCYNEDESVFRVTACASFGAHENSYRFCGTKGQVENVRGEDKILLRYNEWDMPEGKTAHQVYQPLLQDKDSELIKKAGHGGGDFIIMREFLNAVRTGQPHYFDVYFATTMASVGILSYRSILEKGMPYEIPDFRKEEDRKKYENDNLTPFYGDDGSEPTLPFTSRPDYIPEERLKGYYKL